MEPSKPTKETAPGVYFLIPKIQKVSQAALNKDSNTKKQKDINALETYANSLTNIQ